MSKTYEQAISDARVIRESIKDTAIQKKVTQERLDSMLVGADSLIESLNQLKHSGEPDERTAERIGYDSAISEVETWLERFKHHAGDDNQYSIIVINAVSGIIDVLHNISELEYGDRE